MPVNGGQWSSVGQLLGGAFVMRAGEKFGFPKSRGIGGEVRQSQIKSSASSTKEDSRPLRAGKKKVGTESYRRNLFGAAKSQKPSSKEALGKSVRAIRVKSDLSFSLPSLPGKIVDTCMVIGKNNEYVAPNEC